MPNHKNEHQETVIKMTQSGASIPVIMKSTGLTYSIIASLRFRLRAKGLLDHPPTSTFPQPVGSLSTLVKKLQGKERQTLLRMIPEGSTVSEFAMALLNDAIAEEIDEISKN